MVVRPIDGNGVPNNSAWYNQGNFNLGGQVLWRGATPALRWDDGSVSAVNVIPGAILEGGNARRVEWRSSAVHWADFFSNPPAPDGTFASPWPTLNAAIAYTPRGATLNIKSSSTAATIVINKPMILQAPLNGSAVIGQ